MALLTQFATAFIFRSAFPASYKFDFFKHSGEGDEDYFFQGTGP